MQKRLHYRFLGNWKRVFSSIMGTGFWGLSIWKTNIKEGGRILKKNPEKQGLKRKRTFTGAERLYAILKKNPEKQGLKHPLGGHVLKGKHDFKEESRKTRIETPFRSGDSPLPNTF